MNKGSIQPKISVIVPVYNVEAYLEQCLDSILNQTLREIEVICVDDGGTDGSLAILEKYAKVDERLIIVSQVNQGAAVARNTGLDHAKGKYIAFLDSDDFFELDLLELQYEACEKYQADMSICNGDCYDQVTGETEPVYHFLQSKFIEGECVSRKELKEKTFKVTHPVVWNKIYLREFIEKHEIRFPVLKSSEDVYFALMTLALAEKIVPVDKRLVHYRVGRTGNISSVDHAGPMNFALCFTMVKEELIKLGLYEELRWAFINRVTDSTRWHFDKDENQKATYARYCKTFEERYIEEYEIDVYPEPEMINEKAHKEVLNRVYRQSYKNRMQAIKDGQATESAEPKVTVVIPVYNVELYLEECLDSIVNQTLKDIEIICVNDGSKDGSLQILEAYAKKDSRVTVLTQENRGLSATRNRGMEIATGKYIYFMDSDDILDLDALEYLYTESEKDRLDILYFDAVSFYENKELEEKYPEYVTTYSFERDEEIGDVYYGCEMLEEFKRIKSYRSPVWMQFTSRAFLEEIGLDFYEGILHEDQLFTFISMLSAKRTSHRQKAFFHRRVRGDSIMTQKVTANNLRGYVISYHYMKKFAEELRVKETYREAIDLVISNTKISTKKVMKEMKKSGEVIPDGLFSKEETDMIFEMFYEDIENTDRVVKEAKEEFEMKRMLLQLRITELKDKNDARLVKSKEFLQRISDLKKKNADLQSDVKKLEKELAEYKKLAEGIQNTYSYKVAKVIAFIPRKIKASLM